ncbi:hypothetical protein EJ05DRAFT_135523 [Pseudovirgaria hyperparasitica]|uniref:Uncharacterized protein n=1 Tax=Pseudovirgaria hyperparasitica TaxID=470096 RepID=A0A6A6W1C6_9PEZI|nr:uncharacterized protein EJ05DRAFT_135523 [Pseudovirgaria hyperparasitica]KAF2754851.1 hypothetical protein EJ05DRAFT_135523 [Pseudovirgaria hyperparasitica]
MALLSTRLNQGLVGSLTETLPRRPVSPPPPYQTLEPGAPSTDLQHRQEPPRFDDSFDAVAETKAILLERSTPRSQFMQQVKWIEEQITQQRRDSAGRIQTHPFDPTQDIVNNAENIVRARWVTQNIWKSSWGPAWPSNAKSGWSHNILHSKKGPWIPY